MPLRYHAPSAEPSGHALNGIFISYRRGDSAGYAVRLYDRLIAAFGAERVFMDVEGIELGTDFIAAIERALDSSSVFIALIGSEWTQTKDAAGRRRLDDPQDFIRLETTMAIERKLRIVPVLVDDAAMPRTDELPPEMASLARRQAIEINHRQWEASTGALIQALRPILESSASGKESVFGIDSGRRRTLLKKFATYFAKESR